MEGVWKDAVTYPSNHFIQSLGEIIYYDSFRTLKSPRWFTDAVSNVNIMLYILLQISLANIDAGYQNILANCSLSLQPTGKYSEILSIG